MKKYRDNAKQAQGFTVIEVMLFLAISAGLIVALLATVGFTISRQRFSDSVSSLQAFVQQQYNETLNVTNSRGTGTCGVDGDGVTSTSAGDVSIRGASACVVLGRSLEFTPNGSATSDHITVRNVVGREPVAADAANKSGADLLKLYKPGIDTVHEEGYDVAWSARVIGVTPAGVTRILLLRSPDSGEILSFGGTNDASLSGSLNDENRTYHVCIRSADISNAVGVISLLPVSGSEAVSIKTYLTGTEQAELCGS